MRNFVEELPRFPQKRAKRIIREILKSIDFSDLKLDYAIVVDKNGNLVGLFLPGSRLWKFDFLEKYDELFILCWTKECFELEEELKGE